MNTEVEVAYTIIGEKKRFTFEDVRTNVRNGVFEGKVEYPEDGILKYDHVFDEDQSVRWNREQVSQHNSIVRSAKDSWTAEQNLMYNRFRTQLISAIMDDIRCISEETASKIFDEAWSDGHSSGYESVIDAADRLVDFFSIIIKMEGWDEK